MNCDEIHIRLSEYLDKSLDAISTKNIELHLSSCATCRKEAAVLDDCIHQVAALPNVDPPLGFSQRVMAHVHEIEHKPSMWRRLFFPLGTKIPIQATAVVLIGALAFILSQKQEEFKNLKSPTASVPGIPSNKPLETPNDASKGPAVVPEPAIRDNRSTEPAAKQPAQFARQFVDRAKPDQAQIASSAGDAMPAAPAASLKSEAERRAEEKKETPHRRPIQAQEVSTGREVLRPSVDRFGVGVASGGLGQTSLRAAPFAAERSLTPLGELNADVEFVVRRRPPQRRDQSSSSSVDTATENAVAKRSASPAAASFSSFTEIRWFSVQSDLYDSFKKELASEATIESEKAISLLEKDASQKATRELLVKVIILSPAER